MCLTFLVKHILFIINLIFVIIALAIIAFGSYGLHYVMNNDILANLTESESVNGIVNNFNEEILKYICIAVIVFGSVIFLISFCGCCGSITENRCLLILYAIVMFLLSGLSIFLLVTMNSYFGTIESGLQEHMNNTFYSAPEPIKDETINAIQYSLQCCGPHGPYDDFYNEQNSGIEEIINYILTDKLNITGIGYVSPSCCSTFDPHTFVENPEEYILEGFVCTADDVYKDGCVDKILKYFKMVERYLTYILGGITGVEVLTFIFAVYMSCVISSKNKKRRRGYY